MEGQIPLAPRAPVEFRARTESSSSKKRMRGEEDEDKRETGEREDVHVLKPVLTDYLATQCPRISREQTCGIVDIFNKMEKLLYQEMEKRALAEGILRGYNMATAQRAQEQPQRPGPLSYKDVAKIPKVGKKS